MRMCYSSKAFRGGGRGGGASFHSSCRLNTGIFCFLLHFLHHQGALDMVWASFYS